MSTPCTRRAPKIDPSGHTLHSSKQPFRFRDLPPELRNRIYDLVIPRSHVLVTGNHPQKDLQKLRKQYMAPKPIRFRLSGRIVSIDDEEGDPLGLMRTCRSIHDEVVTLFYSKTTPCFPNISTVHKFLSHAPAAGLENLRSIRLNVESYGEPILTRHRKWKDKKDRRWTLTCSRIVAALPNLQSLELDLTLGTWPTTLGINEDWVRPLVILKGNEGLQLVRLTLRHHRFNQTRLGMAARKLENVMMTEQAQEERDIQEALQAVREFKRKAALPPKAKRVLVIKAPTENPAAEPTMKLRHKGSVGPAKTTLSYRTKGLSGFHRVDLNTVGIQFIDCW